MQIRSRQGVLRLRRLLNWRGGVKLCQTDFAYYYKRASRARATKTEATRKARKPGGRKRGRREPNLERPEKKEERQQATQESSQRTKINLATPKNATRGKRSRTGDGRRKAAPLKPTKKKEAGQRENQPLTEQAAKQSRDLN
ncbi:MAG: hypothetical protein V9E95_12875 [Methanothrix soehngenii]